MAPRPRLPHADTLPPPGAMSESAEDLGRITAALASILSGTATDAQCQVFLEAAMGSSAMRLDAQSALAFVDSIERAPTSAPAHLVAQVLAPTGGASSGATDASHAMRKPGIWSRDSERWLVAPRGGMAAACAVLLMAGGLTWSLWRPTDSSDDRLMAPVATSAKEAPLPGPEAAKPVSDPAPMAVPAAVTAPAAPMPAPAQALADPCAPLDLTNSEALAAAATTSEPKPARRAPDRQMKTAAAPDPGCGADPNSIVRSLAEPAAAEGGKGAAAAAGRNPQADQGLRAARPSSQLGGIDRNSPAILSAPGSAPAAARPAAPALHPSAVPPVR
ncbi:MAG TPA: hypothetical protein VGI22_02395 [Xanthobacteraceae bacterium]|jgi:hypothetical protein